MGERAGDILRRKASERERARESRRTWGVEIELGGGDRASEKRAKERGETG